MLPRHVANTILNKAHEEGVEINHLKLQKLMYLLHGWFMAVHKRGLLPEVFEAWEHGVAIDCIFREFCEFGRDPIHGLIREVAPGKINETLSVSKENRDVHGVLDRVWQEFGHLTAVELASICNHDDSPWRKAIECKRVVIPNAWIQEYFEGLAQKAKPQVVKL